MNAEMAYIQATLQGIKTWVRLPKDQWPAAWRRMRDPVCPLVRALYGHPDAGGLAAATGRDIARSKSEA
eukprot:2615742-Amphidinium_carterae.1